MGCVNSKTKSRNLHHDDSSVQINRKCVIHKDPDENFIGMQKNYPDDGNIEKNNSETIGEISDIKTEIECKNDEKNKTENDDFPIIEEQITEDELSEKMGRIFIGEIKNGTIGELSAIESYIRTAVEFRNNGSGNCDIAKQLKLQRLEMICVGAFIQQNNKTNKYSIISFDNKLPGSDFPYRPDLILRNNKNNTILHVELDEDKHRNYNKDEERVRMEMIDEYFSKDKYMLIRFNPSIYENKFEMAEQFTKLINSVDALLYVNYRDAKDKLIKNPKQSEVNEIKQLISEIN